MKNAPLHKSLRPLAAALAAVLLSTAALPPLAYAQARESRFKGEPVTLNFVNADIEGVSRAMGAILKQQFVVDPRVKGTITLYSEEPLSPREAYLNYLAALRGLGFTVVESGGSSRWCPKPMPSCSRAPSRWAPSRARATRCSRRSSSSATRTPTTWCRCCAR
ncbi:hypothetical protein LRS03_22550 [Rhizobacter sp. J219]|nr:hypothetical protein [Rhizobacter sp. J219]MCR5885483.1 hypothetical protein [Rhizobacter sp. J219]